MGNSAATFLSGSGPSARSVFAQSMALNFGGFMRNKVINGDFTIAQRGTSFSTPSNGVYTLDRWVVSYDGTIGSFAVSQQSHTAGQTDVPDEPEFFLRWNHTSAGSGSSFRRIEHRIEGVRTIAGNSTVLPAGRVANVTFYAKADTTRNVTLALVQNFGSGGSGDVSTSGGTLALTASWQKFSVAIVMPSISGKTIGAGNYLALRLGLPINATMTIDISHVQIEESSETSFEQRPAFLEQLLCERFYQIIPMSPNSTLTTLPFKTTMRAAPTVAGGGSGFATSGLVAAGGSCTQTSLAAQTITLEAEL